MLDLDDYHGPLGRLETQLARRRIAVASDAGGRLCLVRPDSVVVEIGERWDDVRRLIDDTSMEVLGVAAPTAAASGFVAARIGPDERLVDRPARWSTAGLHALRSRFEDEGHTVRPNQVYLTEGLARHFRVVAEHDPQARPGEVVPPTAVSTARPASTPLDLPAPLALPGHRPPHVLVLDTGLATAGGRAAHPWLHDHCVVHSPWRQIGTVGRWDDEDEPDDDGAGRLDTQAGHGTFISGVIRQQCPDAIIHHRGVLTSYGDGDDASVIAGIERALGDPARPPFDIVVMAFGAYGSGDEAPPMARALRRLLPGTLVVASAGNDATSRPTYPAALPGVVAVGALDGHGRAAFSNFGPWVDACTPGVDVVSTFFQFDDRDEDGTLREEFRGWARWSGTSFAAPKVAGAIARELYLHGGSGQDAWDRIAARSSFRVPDLGIVVNC